jgi:RIO-like serine/threonine protein kinase
MKGGKVLQKFIDNREGIPRENAEHELNRIIQTLNQRGLSHCDIKARNIVVGDDYHFYLIDNDHVTKHGELRPVGTPG